MTVDIHAMTIDDYDDVIGFWKVTEGMGLSSADTREAIARYLARNPNMSFIARSDQGQVAGAVLCGHDGRRGYIHHLAVHPDFRTQGLGRALVVRCLDCLHSEGIDKCHIFVYKTNESGRTFWKKIGWTERETLVIMSKDIST